MNKDILPCPFCGAAAKVKGYEPTDSFILKYDVVCCKNEQHILELCMDDPQEAIDVWNERAWLGASDEVEQLRERIAELEAAQQWRDASEPPEMINKIHKTSDIVELKIKAFYSHHYNQWVMTGKKTGWRDLPPLPEKGAEG